MKKILLFFSIVLTAVFAFGQDVKLDEAIKSDPRVRIGKLGNGMTYYIRQNTQPKKVVEFRLAVNAGSNQENDNQRGLAHFTEHMAFNGIEGMPGNTMIDKLQSLGVVFGADLNAYTSFDETVYMIPMPLDDPKNLDLGLQILRGWAHGLLYDHKEIDAERGVITEEYRLGLGADDRMRKEYWPVLMKDSRYADRMPIGLLDIIQNFDYQVIKDFYKDWYRPDLQAVIVVGDIDVDQVEAKIKDLFSDIPAVKNPRVKEQYAIGKNKEPLVAVCTDKEAAGNTIMLVRKFPHFAVKTNADFRKQLLIDLYNEMYDARLEELAQDPKCPFIGASTGYSNFIGLTDMYGSQAASKENRILESIEVLMKEDYRVLKYGFLKTELDRAKTALLERMERASNEVDKTESSRYASEYVSNFLHGDPIPGAKREYTLAKKLIDGIYVNEINELAKDWITPENFVAIVMAPEKEGVKVPTKEEVLKVITNEKLKDVTPYVDTYKEQEIVERGTLKPGSIVKSEEIPAIKGKKLTLSNGIEVILKKTDYKNDEILFTAISKGGLSLYKEEDLPSANFAADIIDRSGIAEIDYNSLMKKLKSKQAGVTPDISTMTESLGGSSTPKDLEFFFQYLNAFFTNPRADKNACELVLNETEEGLKMLKANTMYRFIAALFDKATQQDPYLVNQLTMTPEYLKKVDFEKAVRIYKERFANPADFTFVFVGNFDEKVMDELLCVYLGSMKTSEKRENFDGSVFKPNFKGIQKDVEYYGQEEQGWMGLYFEQPYDYNAKNNITVSVLGDVLEQYLLEIVREKMGDVYSPMLQMGTTKYPTPTYTLMIMLGCSPQKTDKLADVCLDILKTVGKKGTDKKTLAKVKKQLISTREKNIQTNTFWRSYIQNKVLYGDDMNAVNEYADMVNAVTNKDLVNFMKKYFNYDNYTRVDLKPEK